MRLTVIVNVSAQGSRIDLPIGGDDALTAGVGFFRQPVDAVLSQVRLDGGEPVCDRGVVGAGMHPQHAAPARERGRFQVQAVEIDAGEGAAAVGDDAQLALEVVSPVMVGADDHLASLARRAQ